MPSPSNLPYALQTLLVVCLVLFTSSVLAQAAGSTAGYNRAIGKAVSAYNEGRFEEARALFAEAHALRPNARTWRGLGTSDFELGHYAEALQELDTALQDSRVPLTPELRVKTQTLIDSARERLAAAPTPVVVAQPTEEPDPLPAPVLEPLQDQPRARRLSGLQIGAVTSLSVGVAGFALAAGFGLRSIHEGKTRDKYCDDDGACSDMRGVDAGNSARRAGNIATAGWVIGGAGLASALVFWWRDRSHRKADQTSAGLRVGPTSIAIVGTL